MVRELIDATEFADALRNYERWKKEVIHCARELHQAAKSVGTVGYAALNAYEVAHHSLWDVMEREPKIGESDGS